MIQIGHLIALAIGAVIGYKINESQVLPVVEKGYRIKIWTKEEGKFHLFIKDYDKAKSIYNRIKKAGKVSVDVLIEYGDIEPGQFGKAESIKISDITWGTHDLNFE